MTELDFDELDKAVNSLMADVDTTKRNTSLDDPEDTVITLDVTPSPKDQPKEPVVAPGAQEPDVAAFATRAQPTTPLAVKRRGQFMDVIHPSSDMKSTPTSTRREGFDLQPSPRVKSLDSARFNTSDLGSSPQQPDEQLVPSFDTSSHQVEPKSDSPATSTEVAPVKNEWPDPIDMALSTEEITSGEASDATSSQSSTSVEAQSGQELPREVLEEVSLPELQEPLTSPFITDAKVVKRPLGGIAIETLTESEQPAESVESSPTPAPAPEAQLPEELKGEVMSLESTSTNAVAPEPSPAPISSRPTSGNGSIAQQYTEQPSSGDQSNTAIYDTSTHHQPLEQPAKKSSPLKWVIFALVLLIVGAAAGAAYFYFTTNR